MAVKMFGAGPLLLVPMLAVIHVAPGVREPQTQRQAPAPRFDRLVRADFFAGFDGDASRLARAMARCEAALAADPEHAEALVWHGAGLMFLAGQAFAGGDATKGLEMWERGFRQMDDAVALAPNDIAVLIPRGTTLLEISRNLPIEQGRPLLAKALGDYEKALAFQRPFFMKLSAHARGELLFGLAEGWVRIGDPLKARRYFEQLVRDGAGSGHVKRAEAWLETGIPPADTTCMGCHRSSSPRVPGK